MRLDINPNTTETSKNTNFSNKVSGENSSTETLKTLRHGIEAAKSGNRNEARVLLMRVAEAEPENETAWLWLASISEYPEELLVFLQNVLNINPENQRAIEWTKQTKSLLAKNVVQRGITASQENQKDIARQCFLQAIAHDNKNEMAWLWLASVVESAEEKISHLKKVLSINAENETAISSLRLVKNQMAQAVLKKANQAVVVGDRETARSYLQEAMKHDDKCEGVWLLKAHLADSFDEKVCYFSKVLEINPENEAARAGLVSIEAVMKSVIIEPKAKAEVYLEENVEAFSQTEIQHSIEESFAQDTTEEVATEEVTTEEVATEEVTAEENIAETATEQVEEESLLEIAEPKAEETHEPIEEKTAVEESETQETVEQELVEEVNHEVTEQVAEETTETVEEVETQQTEQSQAEEVETQQTEQSQAEEVVEETQESVEEFVAETQVVTEETQPEVTQETEVEEVATEETAEIVEDRQVEEAEEAEEIQAFVDDEVHEEIDKEIDEHQPTETTFFDEENDATETPETLETSLPETVEEQKIEHFESEPNSEVEQTQELAATKELEQTQETAAVEQVAAIEQVEESAQVEETSSKIESSQLSEQLSETKLQDDDEDDNFLELNSYSHIPKPVIEVEQRQEIVTETPKVEESVAEVQKIEEPVAETPKVEAVAEVKPAKEIGNISLSNFNPEEGLKEIGSYSYTKLKPEEFPRPIGNYSFSNIKPEEIHVEDRQFGSFEQPKHYAIEELGEVKAEQVKETRAEPEKIEVAATVIEPIVETPAVEVPLTVEVKAAKPVEYAEAKIQAPIQAKAEPAVEVKPEIRYQICPFCDGANAVSETICNSCQAIMNLSDLQMILENEQVDKETVFDAIRKMEFEKLGKDYTDNDYKNLGLAYLNVKDLQNAHDNLKLALHLNPMSIELNSHVTALAGKLELREASLQREEAIAEKENVCHTILVVDDSPTVRKLISTKLERHGHTVVAAVDGMDALAKINEVVPDLILLDITMPRLDGYQVCKLIRNNELTKTTPIVMISGKDGFFDKVRGRMAGSTDFISKPFGPEVLMKMLEMHIH